MMQVNTMLLSFIGEMLSFGASFIHHLNIPFIGTDDQHVLSYNSKNMVDFFLEQEYYLR